MRHVHVQTIDLRLHEVLTTDGVHMPIIALRDEFNRDTCEPTLAATCVAADGVDYFKIDLTRYWYAYGPQ